MKKKNHMEYFERAGGWCDAGNIKYEGSFGVIEN